MATKTSTATKASPSRKTSERTGQVRQKQEPLPEVPDKLYYRIGEVARLCAVETYVLRFWETEFPQLKPHKSGTGQRLYRRREVDLARHIRHLLYEAGYTIPGARQAIQAEARKPHESGNRAAPTETPARQTARLGHLRTELTEILGMLSAGPGSEPRPAERRRARAPRRTPRQNHTPRLFD